MKKNIKHILALIAVFVIAFSLGRLNQQKNQIVFIAEEIDSRDLMEIINAYRIEQGLEFLEIDPYLCDIASQRSAEIIDDWSHDGFYILKHPSQYASRGENLARDFQTDLEIFNGWLNSPTHRDILDGNYNFGCIGKTYHKNITYVVLEVARVDQQKIVDTINR